MLYYGYMFRPDQQPKRQTPPPVATDYNEPKVPSTQEIIDQLRRGFFPKQKIEKPKKETLPNPPSDETGQFGIEFPKN